MVAKIGVGNNLYGSLAYNFEKVKEKEAKVLAVSRLALNKEGTTTLGKALADFELLMPQDTRCKSPIIHISLNPHPDDKLTDEQLESIGREYMDRLGYGEQPYIIFKHDDLARDHIHIVSLRVDATGKKINDSFEHRRSKEITNELEQKYGLIIANESKRITFDEARKADVTRGNIKKQIAAIVRPLTKNYRFQSLGEMNALLSLYHVTSEEVRGEHRGKPYVGLLYFITDKHGNRVSVPVKSSRIGKGVGFAELSKKFERDKETLKTTKENVRHCVTETMLKKPNRDTFVAELKRNGIDVVFRENEQGRIYGITFIDHTEHAVYNGSRLGKSFSANVFQEYFNGTGNHPFMVETPAVNSPIPELTEEEQWIADVLSDDSLTDEIPQDLLDLTVHGIDYKEMAFVRKMRRLHSGKPKRRKL
ncbi:conjugal transfer protein MobB [Petrimonas sp.]|uniref:conjugal transfer protein MobB n=1 Tax=Petrimonas sp. TaxID=2023866 RepID=UPI003F5177A1